VSSSSLVVLVASAAAVVASAAVEEVVVAMVVVVVVAGLHSLLHPLHRPLRWLKTLWCVQHGRCISSTLV
jgi:hypothetical protein